MSAVQNVQKSVPITAPATFMCHVPPGATVIIATNETAADVAWGTDNGVTFATGAIVQANAPTVFQVSPKNPGFDIYMIAGTGAHNVSVTVIPDRA